MKKCLEIYGILRKITDVCNRTQVYRVSKKTHELDFGNLSWISQYVNIVKSWDISHMKGDIHSYVLSTSSFLCDIGEPRLGQNNIGYQTIKIIKDRLRPGIVLPVSRLPDTTQSTACSKNLPIDVTFYLSTRSLLCNIRDAGRTIQGIVFQEQGINLYLSILIV